MHGVGIIISPRNKIVQNFPIYQGVPIRQRRFSQGCDSLGDNVVIYYDAKIMGDNMS